MSDKGNSTEHLRNYLNSKDNNGEQQPQKNINEVQDLGSLKDIKFMSLNIEELPCKWFYPAGTTIMVRPAEIEEIQAFSVVDDNNFYDIYEKVNYMISKCVFIKNPDGTKSSHRNLVDGDRWYLLFVIRDLTFQKGNDLMTKAENSDIMIPIRRGNFKFHEMDEKMKKYYNKINGFFDVKTKIGDFKLAPPTIGLQKSFTDYMLELAKKGETLDQSFLKIIPYTMPGRNSITEEGIEKLLKDYKTIEKDEFQVLNQLIGMMKFGIKEVYTIDESGMEARSSNMFPKKVSGLFVESDTIDDYLI